MLEIFIDADGCPVKAEIYRVAGRYGLPVTVVSNTPIRVPPAPGIHQVVVGGGFDAADDWIAEHAAAEDIVISGDIPLAARCLKKGARVLDFKGGAFTEESIGEALASRELLAHLRNLGEITGGPAPFARQDRSRFLQRLDETIQAVRRKGKGSPDGG